MSPARTRVIHLLPIGGDVPLCGSWDAGTDWTMARAVATCGECVRRLKELDAQGRGGDLFERDDGDDDGA